MNKTTNGKTLLKLEIKELCNERKPPLEIPYSFPSLLEENLENSAPEEKISMITNYLKQQKQSYQDYRKLEQRLLEKEHKKEKFLLKYNTVKENIFPLILNFLYIDFSLTDFLSIRKFFINE